MNGTWSKFVISGTPAAVYQPAAITRARFGVLYLHDREGETLKDRSVYTTLFDQLNLICICPSAAGAWWTDRIYAEFDPALTAERYLLEAVLPFVKKHYQLAPPAIGLLGIGMGGQGALRVAFKHPEQFPVVAAVGAALDCHEIYGRDPSLMVLYASKEHCRQDTALLHIHPSSYPPYIFFAADPDDALWFRGNDRLHEKLTALGVPHQVNLTSRAGGRAGEYVNRLADMAVRFLYNGLEQQSRRLL
jgi:pimeloyl-ACP methyl ester carboxylesterase